MSHKIKKTSALAVPQRNAGSHNESQRVTTGHKAGIIEYKSNIAESQIHIKHNSKMLRLTREIHKTYTYV